MGEAISYGWKGFQNNFGPLVVIMLIILVINGVMTWFAPRGNNFIGLAWTLLSLIVSFIIALGLIRAALAILDGRSPELGDLLGGKGLVSYIIASLLASVIITVGLILCIIPGLIAMFLLWFFGYAIVDEKTGGVEGPPQSDPIGALRTSFDITSKNVGSLLLLGLAIMGINFIGMLLCGIGLLVSLPVTAIAVAYAWRWYSRGVIAPQI